MIKLLLCLLSSFAVGVITLQLRQQDLELRHQVADLQRKIQNQQAKLWSQQVEIAIYTAPNAVSKTIDQAKLKLVPEAPLPVLAGDWISSARE